MNDQSPIQDPEPLDRREARRQRRADRLSDPSRAGSWVAGLVLIILGAMFLMRDVGNFDIPFNNWWALFILIPAVGAFDTALRIYRNSGNEFNSQVRSSLLLGIVLTCVTLMFLFDLSWTYFGPILIILVGLAIIFNTTSRQ